MTRFLVYLFCFIVPFFGAWATNRFLGFERDYGEGVNKSVYSLGTNANTYGAIADHTVFFKPFPYTDTICLWTTYYNWHGQTISLCPGYSTQFMNQGGKTNVPEIAQKCWRWNCNPGFFMMANGECVNQSMCESRQMSWDGSRCVPLAFCPGWTTGYNAASYTLTGKFSVSGSNCHEFRCKDGGFASQTNRNCASARNLNLANVPGARGGSFVNVMVDNNSDPNRGVLQKCGDNHFVTKGGDGKYACVEVQYRQSGSFNDCWKCMNKPDLIKCIMAGSKSGIAACN